jgi:hypothetical protein
VYLSEFWEKTLSKMEVTSSALSVITLCFFTSCASKTLGCRGAGRLPDVFIDLFSFLAYCLGALIFLFRA